MVKTRDWQNARQTIRDNESTMRGVCVEIPAESDTTTFVVESESCVVGVVILCGIFLIIGLIAGFVAKGIL